MNVKVVSALIAMGAVFFGGLAFRPEVAPASATPVAVSPPSEIPNALPPPAVAPGTEEITVAEQAAPEIPALPEELAAAGWDARVGAARAVWVSVSAQRLQVIEAGTTIWNEACATAKNGIGSEMGSYKTPLGWHVIAEKKGDKAPWGQVFRARVATKEVWKPGGSTKEDLVLTRLLWLDGLELGKNKGKNAAGKNVDSKERCIYIHGTNAEELIGTPTSHGCIRLRNDDVIDLYDRLPVGTLVLITE